MPETFELIYGTSSLLRIADVDTVIVLGCVIQGETPHFTNICQGVANRITQLNFCGNVPVIFGILTTGNLKQAEDRAGGKLGNKGEEASITAIKMIEFRNRREKLKKERK